MPYQQSLELVARQHEATQTALGDDIGSRRDAEERRDLAEIIPPVQRRAIGSVDADDRAAFVL